MSEKNFKNVRDFIFWSYANLAMAHNAIACDRQSYNRTDYMIRAKLFKGLTTGKMNIRSIFDDEKIKLQTGQCCNYCGELNNLSLDHIFPQKYGGLDNAENLVYACRSCNSSKGAKNLLEWLSSRPHKIPLMIIRRYIKLTYQYCTAHSLLDKQTDELSEMDLPFKIHLIPTAYPNLSKLVLNAVIPSES
jgi:hypothetical protein